MDRWVLNRVAYKNDISGMLVLFCHVIPSALLWCNKIILTWSQCFSATGCICKANIPQECWFESYLLHCWINSQLTCLGKAQKMAQVPETWQLKQEFCVFWLRPYLSLVTVALWQWISRWHISLSFSYALSPSVFLSVTLSFRQIKPIAIKDPNLAEQVPIPHSWMPQFPDLWAKCIFILYKIAYLGYFVTATEVD